MGKLLEIKELVKTYPGVTAVANVSLAVREKEFIGICGNSGSGKSTFMHCIGTFDEPDSGQVNFCWDNQMRDAFAHKIFYRQCFIGFVFQFFHLLPTLTVIENIMLPLELSQSQFAHESRAQQRDRAMAVLEQFGVAEIRDKEIQEVSGGQLQRVAFARCIVTEPRLILADEPTGNLDQKNREIVYEFLQQQVAATSRSVLMVTHDERSASRYCSKVYQMKDGYLKE